MITLERIEPRPWKNGAGRTRELAVHPRDAGMDDFEWRMSLAEVAADAPFSAFPDVDRCIVLLRGAGMHLRSEDGRLDQRLGEPLEPFHFSGDAALHATLIDGPSSDFNVMTRRGRWRADVTPLSDTHDASACAAALLLCRSGEATISMPGDAPRNLQSGQAALWRHDAPALHIAPSFAATLLLVQLRPLCQDAMP
ncbi:HutD family protein [Albitalea terrae]|uniref:HutD family protein n=1 Tax=Piscinibacter terrae TaxID=2496871 RepID=A0A3N7J0X3_9BURK|nr:HutD family protein [Albitalea terrae]